MELKIQQVFWQRALLAVALVCAAIFLRVWFLQNMGTSLAYITFFPAVTIAALYGGRTSGVISTALSAIYVYFWQTTSNPEFGDLAHWEGLALFAFTGFMLSGFSDALFRARANELQAMELAMHEKRHAEEAKIAEQRIAKSELRFRELFENSPTGMFTINSLTLRFEQANLIAQMMFGYSEAELQGKTVIELTHPDDREEAQRYNGQMSQGLVSRNFVEKRYLRRDGSFFWAESSVSTLKGADGGVEFLIGSFVDITPRKEIESALEHSEHTYRSLFDNMLNGLAYCRMLYEDGQPADFLYLSVNGAFETLTSLKNVVGKKVSEVIPGIRQMDPGLFEIYGRVAATGVAERCEVYVAALQMWFSVSVYRTEPEHFMVVFDSIGERKLAEQKIADYVTLLEGAMEGTLQAVSNMVELRDPYTSGHERRVGLIAADIAREMGWDEHRCKNLQMIGLVHDIGKIAIPAEILSKPSRLTDLEYEMIKGHAEMGYQILKDMKYPLPIAEIIREHHERMDGSGYPQGLKGEQILPEARILAVADVLESMSSHRPYRASLGVEAALREIEEHRETYFDAEVVDAALRLIRHKGYTLPT